MRRGGRSAPKRSRLVSKASAAERSRAPKGPSSPSSRARFAAHARRQARICVRVGHGRRSHCAIAAIDPEPGDEIVTSPITDMGALTPDPLSGRDSRVRRRRSADVQRHRPHHRGASLAERPRPSSSPISSAIPARWTEIVALANARGIPVIEDCAQAFLARTTATFVGTIGTIGCFSLQQGKHITHRRGRPRRHQRRSLARGACSSSSTKRGAMATRSPTTTSWRLNYRM